MIRDVVRKEQNYKCFDCGISEIKLKRELDIHHIIPARLFKRKSDASHRPNLIGLCHPCHMKREYTEMPLFRIDI
jgi:5-methylcytosine-specific restriction endonuclease McrA